MCVSSDSADFLWRLARASRDLSLLPSTEADRKKQLVYEAFEYVKKALEKDDQCFAAHKVRQHFQLPPIAGEREVSNSSAPAVVRGVSQRRGGL